MACSSSTIPTCFCVARNKGTKRAVRGGGFRRIHAKHSLRSAMTMEGKATAVPSCFAYPKTRFKDYPTFEAATFSVSDIKSAVTEKKCLGGEPDWVIDPRESGKTVNINDVRFKLFETDGVATGHGLDGHVYRTFHRNRCYELSIRIASTGSWVFGPVKEFTRKDWDEVNGRLKQSLDSFRFLR